MNKSLILVITLLFFGGGVLATPIDSLRTEKVGDQYFVIHEVEPKETLFGLSRRYNTSVDAIRRHNPILATNDLKVGDILRIPIAIIKNTYNGKLHEVMAGETLFSISRAYNVSVDQIRALNNMDSNGISIGQKLRIPESKENNVTVSSSNQVENPGDYHWHQVAQGETLYGLSLVYGVDIEDLKRWNDLNGNAISIGDSLIVGDKKDSGQKKDVIVRTTNEVKIEVDTNTKKEEADSKKEETNKEIQREDKNAIQDDVKVTRQVVKNEANFEEIVETGLAQLIDESGKSKKYLALHRTAKIGTIIRVRNEMNDQEVFVRVIGHLPDTGINDKVLIKISQAAYDRLAAIDKTFRVRISYFPD